MILSTQVVGRIYHRVGPRRLIIGGVLGFALTSCGFLGIELSSSLWRIRGILFFRGITMAFAFVPLQAASYANIRSADTGRASAPTRPSDKSARLWAWRWSPRYW